MKIWGFICLLAVIVPAQSIGADLYRYTDRHGNEIYTDDLNNVPAGQRENAKVPDSWSLLPPGVGEGQPSLTSDPMPDAAIKDLKAEKEALDALKEKLKKEFSALAEENARLKAAQKAAVTPDQRKAFNKHVVSFNTRFQAYKEKEAVYQSRLDQYDLRLKALRSNHDN